MFKLVVLTSLLAVAASAPSGWYGLGGIHGWPAPLAAPLIAPVVAHGHGIAVAATPIHGAYNYRGPWSLAPGQPASILAADGRPLDTLSVNADKAAHYTAKALDHTSALHGLHILKKRSAPLIAAPVAWSHSARIDLPAVAHGVPAAPWALHGAVGPWGLGPWGHAGVLAHAGPWGHHW